MHSTEEEIDIRQTIKEIRDMAQTLLNRNVGNTIHGDLAKFYQKKEELDHKLATRNVPRIHNIVSKFSNRCTIDGGPETRQKYERINKEAEEIMNQIPL